MPEVNEKTSLYQQPDKSIFIKVLSLFSTVRVYNVAIIALAQLLAAVFIIAPEKTISEVATDYKLWLLIIASALSIAGGYIKICYITSYHYL